MKKVILIVLSVLILSFSIVPVAAAAVDNGNTIQPLWTNTSTVDCCFLYVDGMGYVESAVSGNVGTSSIKTDMYLYKWIDDDWVYVDELHEIKYRRVAGTSLSFEANGEYFRADYTFTVTKNGVDEIIERTIYQNVG